MGRRIPGPDRAFLALRGFRPRERNLYTNVEYVWDTDAEKEPIR